jgi:hypothetical protein
MGFLVGLMGKIVGEKFAGLAAYGLIVILIVGGVMWLRADAYSDGKHDEEARWIEAIENMQEDAEASADAADEAADEREDVFIDRVREERERIDEAIEQGTDPFDVLFGAD